ncbi:hypothetical protein [uncultured Ruminococcus sp.]|uniref:hypothetical protein n=1 Tax=uncultured Ruminococcus sp. TaxID=165186 RepID=UPI00292CDA44|nr:hypothetical protein [uncultured Ruminococcus sp.]
MSSVERALQQFIASVTHLNLDSIYNSSRMEEFKKEESEDTLVYPAIAFGESTDYLISANQDDVDLEKSVKADVYIFVSFYSRSIDDIIIFEETFTNLLSSNYDLRNCCDIPDVMQAYLSGMTNINREPLPNKVFRSYFLIRCSDIILMKEIENPIRFELDRSTQERVLKHLFLLESVYHMLITKQNSSNDTEINGVIHKQIFQLEKQISDMFIFKDICSDNFSYKNHSFEYCYKLLKDKESKSLTIKDIFKRDSDRINEEEEKKRTIEEEKTRKKEEAEKNAKKLKLQFSKYGDIQSNRYTDAVIQDFQKNISLDNISVYGGTSFNKWYSQFEEKSLVYPNILITDLSNYTLDAKTYENETKDGNKITHEYNTIAFPIQYGILVSIFSDNPEKNAEIEKNVIEYYTEQRKVKVPDYKKQDEYTVLTVQHAKNLETKREKIGNINKTTVNFTLFNTVYYVSGYKPEECENNQRLQLRLLQQAEYALIKCGQCGRAEMDLNSLYKPFINRERILFGLLDSSAYRKLQKMYNQGMPINKELFDSAMKSIVNCYPDLYQQFINGWSYSQIEDNLKGYSNYYKTRFNYLIDLLQIPEKITKHGYELYCRSHDELVFYINKMLDPYCELSSTVDEYAEQRGAQREREDRARAEREAMQEEEGYYDDYKSSSRSIGGDILKTAFGVALGNKISGNSGRGKNTPVRKDYSYTDGCRQRVRVKNLKVQERTCRGCTMAPYCTKYR